MTIPHLRSIAFLASVVGSMIVFESRAQGSSYYTITDLGLKSGVADKGQGFSLTWPQQAQLPGKVVLQGVVYPSPLYYRMEAWANNTSGTVIGGVPSGQTRADPLDNLTLGYTQLQPNGQYGPFVPLTNEFYGYSFEGGPLHSGLYLDNANQILVFDGAGGRLLDLNAGTTTDLTQLVPPGALEPYGVIHFAALNPDGTIALSMMSPNGSLEPNLLLTPPSPTPEPSSLTLFAVALAGLAVRVNRSRRPL